MGTKWRPQKDEAEHFKKLEKSNQGYLDRAHTPEKWNVKTVSAPIVAPNGKTKDYRSEANMRLQALGNGAVKLKVDDYKKTLDGREYKKVPAKEKIYPAPRPPVMPINVPKGTIPPPPPPPPKRTQRTPEQTKPDSNKKPARPSLGRRIANCVGRLCGKVGK